MEPGLILNQYRVAVDKTMITTLNFIRVLLESGYDPQDTPGSVERLSGPLTEFIRLQRAEVYRQATRLLRNEAARVKVSNPYIPPQTYYPEKSVKTVLRRHLRGPSNEATKRVSVELGRHVESAGRQTIARAVDDGKTNEIEPAADPNADVDGKQPIAWARMLSGAENCGFCVMLASRGPVYRSERHAGKRHVSQPFRDAGVVQYANSFHNNCDCLVVPVYHWYDWLGRDSFVALERFYTREISAKGITYNNNPLKNEINERREKDGKNPLPEARNEVIAQLDKRLREMKKNGKELPIPNIRLDISGGAARVKHPA